MGTKIKITNNCDYPNDSECADGSLRHAINMANDMQLCDNESVIIEFKKGGCFNLKYGEI